MIRKIIFALGLVTSIFATSSMAQQQVGNGFWKHGLEWDRNEGHTIAVYTLKNEGGRIAVCGSYYTQGRNSTRKLSKKAMKLFRLSAGNVFVVQNLTFFNEVRSEGELGQNLNCRTTRVAWFANANSNVTARANNNRVLIGAARGMGGGVPSDYRNFRWMEFD